MLTVYIVGLAAEPSKLWAQQGLETRLFLDFLISLPKTENTTQMD